MKNGGKEKLKSWRRKWKEGGKNIIIAFYMSKIDN